MPVCSNTEHFKFEVLKRITQLCYEDNLNLDTMDEIPMELIPPGSQATVRCLSLIHI